MGARTQPITKLFTTKCQIGHKVQTKDDNDECFCLEADKDSEWYWLLLLLISVNVLSLLEEFISHSSEKKLLSFRNNFPCYPIKY